MGLTNTSNYYEPLGLATVQWAAVEQTLDVLIHLIFTHHRGNEIEAVVPVSLKRKIKYLRKAFRKIEALSQHKDAALPYFDRVIALSESRHDLVHGFSSQALGAMGPIQIQRIIYQETGHAILMKTITLDDIMGLITDSRTLFGDLMSLTMRVAAPFPGGTLKETTS